MPRTPKKPDGWTPLPHHSLGPDEEYVVTGAERDKIIADLKAQSSRKHEK